MGAALRVTLPVGTPAAPPSGSWDDDRAHSAHGDWCVDDGTAIHCLTTRQLWMALAQGRIAPEMRAWREGFGHWLPIAQIPELTQEEDATLVPEQSEIRLRARSSAVPEPAEYETALGYRTVGAGVAEAFASRIVALAQATCVKLPRWRSHRRDGLLAALGGVAIGVAGALIVRVAWHLLRLGWP